MLPGIGPELRLIAGKASAMMRQHRAALLVVATIFFIAGIWWSIGRLDFSADQIQPLYIAILAIVLVPASMLYAAASFVIMAKGAGAKIPFTQALRIACVAQLAEFLPVPGGAIVRGGALMQLGTSGKGAAAHVTVGAILWVACAAIAAGLSFGPIAWAGIVLLATGIVVLLLCLGWLLRESGVVIALLALGIRIIGLLLSALRIGAAFLAMGIALSVTEIYPFTFATILGSASSIAPGGLGIGEALAAFMATLTSVAPAAAFLAVGLNRFIGLAVSGIATGIVVLTNSKSVQHLG